MRYHYNAMFNGIGDDTLKPIPLEMRKYILMLKIRFLKEGNDPKDFPQYLKEQGVEMVGPVAKISEQFMVICKLSAD